MFNARLISVLLFAALVSGCGSDTPSLKPLASDAVVLAFGDSLTAGYGASAEESYPQQLESIIPFRVINGGRSGETSVEGAKRLPKLLATHRPDLVVILHGGNDILRNLPKTDTVASIESMIENVRQYDADVVLVAVPDKRLFSDAAPFYSEISDRLNVPIDREVISDILKSKSLKSDTVHPNARGYRELAERVAELLEDAGAL